MPPDPCAHVDAKTSSRTQIAPCGRSRSLAAVARLLLLIAGIEPNPGPNGNWKKRLLTGLDLASLQRMYAENAQKTAELIEQKDTLITQLLQLCGGAQPQQQQQPKPPPQRNTTPKSESFTTGTNYKERRQQARPATATSRIPGANVRETKRHKEDVRRQQAATANRFARLDARPAQPAPTPGNVQKSKKADNQKLQSEATHNQRPRNTTNNKTQTTQASSKQQTSTNTQPPSQAPRPFQQGSGAARSYAQAVTGDYQKKETRIHQGSDNTKGRNRSKAAATPPTPSPTVTRTEKDPMAPEATLETPKVFSRKAARQVISHRLVGHLLGENQLTHVLRGNVVICPQQILDGILLREPTPIVPPSAPKPADNEESPAAVVSLPPTGAPEAVTNLTEEGTPDSAPMQLAESTSHLVEETLAGLAAIQAAEGNRSTQLHTLTARYATMVDETLAAFDRCKSSMEKNVDEALLVLREFGDALPCLCASCPMWSPTERAQQLHVVREHQSFVFSRLRSTVEEALSRCTRAPQTNGDTAAPSSGPVASALNLQQPQELRDAHARNTVLQNEVTVMQRQMEAMSKQLRELEQVSRTSQQTATTAQKLVEDLRKELAFHKQTNNQLLEERQESQKEAVQTSQQHASDLQRALVRAEQAELSLEVLQREGTHTSQQQVDDARRRAATAEESLEKVRVHYTGIVLDMETKVSLKERDIAILKRDHAAQIAAGVDAMEEMAASHAEALKKLGAQFASELHQARADHRVTTDRARSELRDANAKAADLKAALAEARQERDAALATAESVHQGLAAELARAQQGAEDAELRLGTHTRRIAALEAEGANLSLKYHDALQTLSTTQAALSGQAGDLAAQRETAEARHREAQEYSALLRQQCTDALTTIEMERQQSHLLTAALEQARTTANELHHNYVAAVAASTAEAHRAELAEQEKSAAISAANDRIAELEALTAEETAKAQQAENSAAEIQKQLTEAQEQAARALTTTTDLLRKQLEAASYSNEKLRRAMSKRMTPGSQPEVSLGLAPPAADTPSPPVDPFADYQSDEDGPRSRRKATRTEPPPAETPPQPPPSAGPAETGFRQE